MLWELCMAVTSVCGRGLLIPPSRPYMRLPMGTGVDDVVLEGVLPVSPSVLLNAAVFTQPFLKHF